MRFDGLRFWVFYEPMCSFDQNEHGIWAAARRTPSRELHVGLAAWMLISAVIARLEASIRQPPILSM